jgi:ceramide glucosyltransferase
MENLLEIAAFSGLACSLAYTTFAIARVATFGRRRGESTTLPPVTIAKPLYGLEPSLYENLRSFCEQDYPEYEVIFAVRNANDPAAGVVRQLQADCPGLAASLVVEPRALGTNLKVSNLIAIARKARHDLLVIADSDMRVGRDYLRAVVAPFADARVGAVTCPYVGRPLGGVPSKLGAMFINESFLPSVLVSLALEPLSFCFGATMAVRRSVLEAIGGFEALADYLADDYMLGNLVRRKGLDVALVPYVVETTVAESTLSDLFQHELRWARTIRNVRPAGYTLSLLTMSAPWAVASLLLSRFSPAGWYAFAAALLLRVALHVAVRIRFKRKDSASPAWIPLREALSFIVYCASHLGRRVLWKETRFAVTTDGQLHQEGAPT